MDQWIIIKPKECQKIDVLCVYFDFIVLTYKNG